MKLPVFIFLLFLSSISASAQIERKPVAIKTDSAQTAGNNKADKQSQKDRLKDLDLTKEQKGKVKEIRQAGKSAKEAIEKNTELSETDKKKQLRDLQKAQAQKVQAILTEEQKAKFKASKQNDP